MPRLAVPFEVTTRLLGQTGPVWTFDDGPHSATTPVLLDWLAERGETATFFVVGEQARRHPDLIRRIANAGHAVGNHSWSHAMPWRLRAADQRKEYDRTRQLIEDLTGQRCDRVRPPYGMHSPALAGWAAEWDAVVWIWSVMPPDYRDRSPDSAVLQDIQRTRPGQIVCLHEKLRTVRLLREWSDRSRRVEELTTAGR